MEAMLACGVFEKACRAVKEVALNESEPQKSTRRGSPLGFWVESSRGEDKPDHLEVLELVCQYDDGQNGVRFICPDHVDDLVDPRRKRPQDVIRQEKICYLPRFLSEGRWSLMQKRCIGLVSYKVGTSACGDHLQPTTTSNARLSLFHFVDDIAR